MTYRSLLPAAPRFVAAGFLGLLILSTSAFSQRDAFNDMMSTTTTTKGYYSNGGTPLLLKVTTADKTRLDRQAMVKVTNQSTHTDAWQTTDGNSEALIPGLQFGHYEIEVSAVGYITAHKDLELSTQNSTYHIEIVLESDPSAIAIRDADQALPSKARKEARKGVSALKSGNLNNAQKWLDAAYQAAPASADLNFLLGYVYYQKEDFDRAKGLLQNATTINPHDAQALTLLGRVGLRQGDYVGASTILRQAVDVEPDSWMAHHFLADAYLKQRDYGKAKEQALLAIGDNKVKANPSQLVLGQALVNLGQQDEGIKVLKSFLEDAPKNPASPQVRELISKLEAQGPVSAGTSSPSTVASLSGIDSLVASPEPTFSVKPWKPSGVDEVKPLVAADTPCPYDAVIQTSGLRVKKFVDDVSRISAIEHLLQEQLDDMGNPLTKDTRQFNYVASISESTPGYVAVDEFREEHLGIADFPDQIASTGFATLALVFHPAMRDNFEMVCEGLGAWHGQATWLVHFKQRDDRPARMHDYKVGSQVYSLKLKGRAWIRADSFQVVHIESELVEPLPQIRLASETQIVDYGPVPFAKKNIQLWLPQSAEIYLDFRKHRYYRKHSFDHYMLFSVDADETRKAPKGAPADTPPQPN